MTDNNFRVTITNEDDSIRGALQELHGNDIMWQTDFDPLTILGDLLNTADYDEALSPYSQNCYTLKQGYAEHPFFLINEIKGGSSRPKGDVLFFVAFHALKEIITSGRQLSASEFEVLKQFLELKFMFRLELREENPLYDMGYTENPFNHMKVTRYQYASLDYNYGFNTKVVMEEIQRTKHRFNYECSSIEDIIFSVLHYLIFFGYKFGKCFHCGNYYAAEIIRKYCKRNSPYKGCGIVKYNFSQNTKCEQAVRNIMLTFKRRKNTIYKNLSRYSERQTVDNFLNNYADHRAVAKKYSSIENLHALESFLLSQTGAKKKEKTN